MHHLQNAGCRKAYLSKGLEQEGDRDEVFSTVDGERKVDVAILQVV
jgi:hypothetical protein